MTSWTRSSGQTPGQFLKKARLSQLESVERPFHGAVNIAATMSKTEVVVFGDELRPQPHSHADWQRLLEEVLASHLYKEFDVEVEHGTWRESGGHPMNGGEQPIVEDALVFKLRSGEPRS